MSFVRYAGRIKTPNPTNDSQRAPHYIMNRKDKSMPLHKGNSKEVIGENIGMLEKEGYPDKQAIAISLNTARREKTKPPHERKEQRITNRRHKEHR
jgi:hypothetical protein